MAENECVQNSPVKAEDKISCPANITPVTADPTPAEIPFTKGDVANSNCSSYTADIPNIPNSVPNISIPKKENVTTGTVNGTGVFDLYMRAGLAHLEFQYSEGRIKGADYASAYVALVEVMIREANSFVIESVRLEIAAQMFRIEYANKGVATALAQQQIIKSKAEVDMVCIEKDEMLASGPIDRGLKIAQGKKIEEEMRASREQVSELKSNGKIERALKTEQIKKTDSEKSLVCRQTEELSANGSKERALKVAQIDAQCKTVELYDRQITGFDDKRDSDAFSSIMQAWAIQGSEITADQGSSVLNTLKYKWMEEINGTGTSSEMASVSTGGILGKMMDQTKLNSTGKPR